MEEIDECVEKIRHIALVQEKRREDAEIAHLLNLLGADEHDG